jgi:hypothetical protein
MHYFVFPEKDTTVYESSSSLNAGMDPILEIRKDVSDTGDTVRVSRTLIKFPLTYISQSVVDSLITSPTYFLNLYDAHPAALAVSQSLRAYPISQSWDMGAGRSDDDPVTDEGASWKFRHGKTDGQLWTPAGPSGSGATWFSGSSTRWPLEVSYSLDQTTRDVRLNVSDIVNNWIYSGSSYPNEGFIIKRSGSIGNLNSGSDEGSKVRYGNFSFFSSDTHTKFPPTLEVVWDDSKFSTGSLSPITGSDFEDMVMYTKGLRPEYSENAKAKIRVVGRARFPAKTYSTTPSNLTVKYLPSGSTINSDGTYYSIRDAEDDSVVVPFDSGSLVSCDSNGNYFNIWLGGYQPERYYKLVFRAVSGSGTADEVDQYFDEGFTFKVTK